MNWYCDRDNQLTVGLGRATPFFPASLSKQTLVRVETTAEGRATKLFFRNCILILYYGGGVARNQTDEWHASMSLRVRCVMIVVIQNIEEQIVEIFRLCVTLSNVKSRLRFSILTMVVQAARGLASHLVTATYIFSCGKVEIVDWIIWWILRNHEDVK